MNVYRPHVYVVPEDRADAQLAIGFVEHHEVDDTRVKVMPEVGGWSVALAELRDVYVPKMRANRLAHVVIVIDFDGEYDARRPQFEAVVPADLRDRAFVIGARTEPEDLKGSLRLSLPQIGNALAGECHAGEKNLWGHGELQHNRPDLERLLAVVRPVLFHG